MRTYTVEHTVYKLSELDEEAQQKAIEQYRESMTESLDLEYITDDFAQDLQVNGGYEDVQCYWSGFWSQGDGACFTAGVDIATWLKARKLANKYRLLYQNAESVSIDITHRHNYYYATSTNVDYENYHEMPTEAQDEKLDNQLAAVVALIEADREELGNKLYKQLEEEWDYQTSDEAIRENIAANEYEFYKDGRMA